MDELAFVYFMIDHKSPFSVYEWDQRIIEVRNSIFDDKSNKSLVSASSIKEKISEKKKSDMSIHVAGLLAKKALEKKITKVYFDRGRYKYHGRIKIFAEALRKNGLNF